MVGKIRAATKTIDFPVTLIISLLPKEPFIPLPVVSSSNRTGSVSRINRVRIVLITLLSPAAAA
jgi:hypothetical protein